MKLYQLAYICNLYGKDGKEYREIRETLRSTPNLASPEQQEELLQFLNKWGCRIAKDDFPELKVGLQQWWADHQLKLPLKDILDLDGSDFEGIESAYRALLKTGAGLRFQDTATAKTLHVLRPDTLPIWDAPIRAWFAPKGDKTYSDFVRYVAFEELRELKEDVERLGLTLSDVPELVHPGCGNVTLVKLVDEYYWMTKTREYEVPTRKQLEEWLGWMPEREIRTG